MDARSASPASRAAPTARSRRSAIPPTRLGLRIEDIALSVRLKIAAIRSGTEPLRKLPIHSFERQLDTPVLCPRCGITYNLVVDWDEATDRWFPETSRPLIRLLTKAIHMGHGNDHRITHFETAGVVVESVTA